jgi:hypothetical protein
MFNLFTNLVEGTVQATLGTAKLVVSPVTQLVDLDGESHAEKAVKNIKDGLDKIGKDD